MSQHSVRTLSIVLLTVVIYTSCRWTHHCKVVVAIKDCFILLSLWQLSQELAAWLSLHGSHCVTIMLHFSMSVTAPSRVTGVSLTRTVENGTLTLMVNWTTPQSDVAISQYQVQYRRSGMTSWSSATLLSGSPPATSTILTGLDPGTEYNVRVRAVSELGAGEWSVVFDSEFWCIVCCYKMNLHLCYTFRYVRIYVTFSACCPVVLKLHPLPLPEYTAWQIANREILFHSIPTPL